MNTWQKAVTDYVCMRRSLGFKLHEAERALLDFAAFLKRRHAAHITITLAMRWAQQNPAARPIQWAQRLSFIRGFARHWSAYDPQTEIPPCGLLPYRPRRAQPYLYSRAEIRQLLRAAQQLPPAQGLQARTYYCLLGLLSVTGLRLSEVLNLQPEDVNLAEGFLTIRCGKFGKSRLGIAQE